MSADVHPRGRSLDGLRIEYEIALREGKTWIAREVRRQATKLAMRTGQTVPTWAQGWDP